MTGDRRRPRETSARRERDRDPDCERERERRRSRTQSLQRAADETPEATPRSNRRSRPLNADSLTQLNEASPRSTRPPNANGRHRSRDYSDETREERRQRRRERSQAAAQSREQSNGYTDESRAERRSRGYTSTDETPRGHRRSKTYSGDEAREQRKNRRHHSQSKQATGYTAEDGHIAREDRRSRDYRDGARDYRDEYREEQRRYQSETDDAGLDERRRHHKRKSKSSQKKRLVSGAVMEEGMSGKLRGGGSRPESEQYMLDEKELMRQQRERSGSKGDGLWARTKTLLFGTRKRLYITLGTILALLILIIVAAVLAAKKNSGDDNKSSLSDTNESDIPTAAQGTYLDPFTWYDTTDFNITYTNDTVGDLPVMGLYSKWDDSARANDHVPKLSDDWGSYGDTPARGVNLGGWLNLEPFITPSFFNYDSNLGIIDEWTLCSYLGPDKAASKLEQHYATFVTESTFAAIADAGLDHVRIPYGYWAVQTYDDDPYVFRTSWRYLLRGIEWARKYGLRVNLDIHGLPGSQNGWNHSGRQGAIGWLNGTNGDLNAQRSLDVHDRLSKFFGQPRYKNIIKFYGLANEPKMTVLDTSAVLAWTVKAHDLVKGNGVDAIQVFGDGFMGLDNWQGKLTGYNDLALDVHQYVIFNTNQIVYTHQQKIQYACAGWTQQADDSMNPSTGYGPTLFAEWSQADTDCAKNLNNVGWGNRWEGTYNTGNSTTSILTPRCPSTDDSCKCTTANDDPSRFSDTYKQFLLMFAEAQMHSFEHGWGWWYWTWDTESSPQWSYKAGLAAGILPKKAYERDFACDADVPSFGNLPEYYKA